MDTSVHQHECNEMLFVTGVECRFEGSAVCLVLRVVRRGLAAGGEIKCWIIYSCVQPPSNCIV